jgi:phytoene/squalene synthetase
VRIGFSRTYESADMQLTSGYRAPIYKRRDAMTPEEQITKMKKAINQAVKVMGDRFGSTEEDVERTIDELKASMQTAPAAAAQTLQSGAAVTAGG